MEPFPRFLKYTRGMLWLLEIIAQIETINRVFISQKFHKQIVESQ
jgi:hypothetical protein